jgi:hypothetical protein
LLRDEVDLGPTRVIILYNWDFFQIQKYFHI